LVFAIRAAVTFRSSRRWRSRAGSGFRAIPAG
jgi:hypothetical protein